MEVALRQPELDVPAMRRLAGELALRNGQPLQALDHLLPLLEAIPDDRQLLQLLLMSGSALAAKTRRVHASTLPRSSTRSCMTCGWRAWPWKKLAARCRGDR